MIEKALLHNDVLIFPLAFPPSQILSALWACEPADETISPLLSLNRYETVGNFLSQNANIRGENEEKGSLPYYNYLIIQEFTILARLLQLKKRTMPHGYEANKFLGRTS